MGERRRRVCARKRVTSKADRQEGDPGLLHPWGKDEEWTLGKGSTLQLQQSKGKAERSRRFCPTPGQSSYKNGTPRPPPPTSLLLLLEVPPFHSYPLPRRRGCDVTSLSRIFYARKPTQREEHLDAKGPIADHLRDRSPRVPPYDKRGPGKTASHWQRPQLGDGDVIGRLYAALLKVLTHDRLALPGG